MLHLGTPQTLTGYTRAEQMVYPFHCIRVDNTLNENIDFPIIIFQINNCIAPDVGFSAKPKVTNVISDFPASHVKWNRWSFVLQIVTVSNLWYTNSHKQQDLSEMEEYFVSRMPVQLEKGIITPELLLRWHTDSFLPVVIVQLKQFSRCLIHLLNVEVCIKSLWEALSFCVFTQFMHGYDVKPYLKARQATQSFIDVHITDKSRVRLDK